MTASARIQQSLEASLVPLVQVERRRIDRAHAWARFACTHFPLPMFWFAERVVCRAMLPRLRGRVRCPTMYGFDLVVRSTNGGQYYRCGFYEQGTMHVIRHCLRPGDVFVDAGASVGQMSLFASTRVGPTGRVLAFEPMPDRYEDLEAGVAINRMSNVRVYRFGLADEPAEKSLYLRGSPSMFDQTRTADTMRVTVRPLDAVLDECDVRRVRMLKIDVEGFEVNVLRGAARLLASAEPPIVCYEHGIYHPTEDIAELLRKLSGDRYSFFQLTGTMHRPSPLRVVNTRRLRNDNVIAVPTMAIAALPESLFGALGPRQHSPGV